MHDLTSLDLKPVYDSAYCNLVEDLISPLLANSLEYCRGVGYFSSGWLRVASEGLLELISSGGEAKLIMSPILEQKDWEAIVLGQQAQESEILHKSLSATVTDLAHSLQTETLNALAWMIADNLLHIRFAVPRQDYKDGDYHDKVAYYRDSQGNCVATHGSFNDSIKGTLNGEAISVFRSWEMGHLAHVEHHVNRLDQLWNDDNPQFCAFELPEAVRQQIVKLRSTASRPYETPALPVSRLKNTPRLPAGIELHDYQKEAIRSWQDNGCRGLFEMATGTGKTYTSLGAATEELDRRKKLATVILVPYRHLLDQWKEDCDAFGFSPVLCSSDHPHWRTELKSAISDFRLTGKHLCVIAVHQTASNDAFLRAFNPIPDDQKLLIADEVHGLGAKKLRSALSEGFGSRLGLSATPRRWYDEEGTRILTDYFDKICYEFSLSDAIDRGFLVPYEYEPLLVNLTDDEELRISELSALIGMLTGKQSKNGLSEDEQGRLEKAMRDRAMTVKQAEGKMEGLRQLVHTWKGEGRDLSHSLFYSPESQHREVLQVLKSAGVMAHEFVGTVSAPERKRVLAQFAEGHILSLVAMKCLDEGVDVPATRTAFFIASTTNPKEFIQRRGRVLRRSPGKSRAHIFDFIVVPSRGTSDDVAKYLLEREMPRFAEFSDLAVNNFAARKILWPILDRHRCLHFLDMKPWDVYHHQNPETRDELR